MHIICVSDLNFNYCDFTTILYFLIAELFSQSSLVKVPP